MSRGSALQQNLTMFRMLGMLAIIDWSGLVPWCMETRELPTLSTVRLMRRLMKSTRTGASTTRSAGNGAPPTLLLGPTGRVGFVMNNPSPVVLMVPYAHHHYTDKKAQWVSRIAWAAWAASVLLGFAIAQASISMFGAGHIFLGVVVAASAALALIVTLGLLRYGGMSSWDPVSQTRIDALLARTDGCPEANALLHEWMGNGAIRERDAWYLNQLLDHYSSEGE